MRNLLLAGTAALGLALSGVSAFAYYAPNTYAPNFYGNTGSPASVDVQQPSAVLGAYVGTVDSAPVYRTDQHGPH